MIEDIKPKEDFLSYHVDTSVLISFLLKQKNWKKAKDILNESRHRKKPGLGCSIICLGEALKAILESDYTESTKQFAIQSLCEWIQQGAKIYNLKKEDTHLINTLQSYDSRLMHNDAHILAVALSNQASKIYVMDYDFNSSKNLMGYCKSKGLEIINLHDS